MSRRGKELASDSIDDLKKMAVLSAGISNKTTQQLIRSTMAVRQRAEELQKSGDEEMAYVLYMKYFDLTSKCQQRKDFKKYNDLVRECMGTNKEIHGRMDVLENLHKSLTKRYADKLAEKMRKAAELEQQNKVHVEVKNVCVTTTSRDTSLFILISSLYKHIYDKSGTLLLIDCRSAQAYYDSKIRFSNMINVAEEIIQKGLSADKLSKKLSPKDLEYWGKRGEMDSIVLIDDETNEQDSMDSMKPIWLLRDILIHWDQDVTYKRVVVADGGFYKFCITYPMYTTNPNYKPKSSMVQNMYPTDLERIEYPSLDDIKMKRKETEPAKYIPRVDRTNKPMPGQKPMGNASTPIDALELARQKEIMFDQAFKTEQEILTIGNELKRNFVSTTSIPNDVDKTEWFNKQSELEYKFIQKENELNDTINEIQSVDQHELDNQMGTLQIDKKDPELAEINARLETKRNKLSQNKHIVNETKQEVESKMNVVRERQKRHLKEKDEEDELIRPKMPTFDRSSKPTIDRLAPSLPVYRDFSPEFGSYGEIGATGLKNLGNTCYMNSIIQCLLNLDGFRNYLTDGNYTKHLNRKSKTRGQITEELAQLAKEVWSGKYKSVAPRDFRNAFGQEYKMFSTYDQQDSHELLVQLVDVLHSELQIPMDDKIMNAKVDKEESSWREFVKNTNSIIQTLFFGQIRSTLKCCACGYESATYDGFSHLSLELPQNSRQCYLTDCLDLYFNGESIDGWSCSRCQSNRGAIKKLDISRLPPILVIHFKRFYVSTTSNSIEKKLNYVHFPIEDFSITDYIMPSARQRLHKQYNLFAVSNHYGSLNRGHYTAFCKNVRSKQWYKYDDNYVTHISGDDVNSSAGYILFYSSY